MAEDSDEEEFSDARDYLPPEAEQSHAEVGKSGESPPKKDAGKDESRPISHCSSIVQGHGAKVSVKKSKVKVGGTKNIYNNNSEKDQSWEITLNQTTQNGMVDRSWLTWKPPCLQGRAKVRTIKVRIKKDDGSILLDDTATSLEPRFDVPTDKLEYESFYQATVTYYFETNENAVQGSERIETLPHPPKIQAPRFNDQHVTITWTPPSLNFHTVSVFDEFDMERVALLRVKECQVQIPVTGNIKWGTYYKLQVAVETATGKRNSSTQRLFVGDPTYTPTNVQASLSGKGEITVTWEKPLKNTTVCVLKHSVNDVEKEPVPIWKKNKHKFKAEPGTRNIIFVRAIFDDQETTWVASNEIVTEARSMLVKEVQVSPSLKNRANALDVLWSKVKDATGYYIVYEVDNFKSSILVNGDKDAVTLTKLQPATKYAVYVIAIKGQETGIPSEKIYAETGLGQVGVITATAEVESRISVSFEEAQNCNEHRVKLYELTESNTRLPVLDQEQFLQIGRTGAIVQAPKCDTFYQIGITAVYGDKEGEEVSTKQILTVPEKIDTSAIEVALQERSESKSFTIKWIMQKHCIEHQLRVSCCDGRETSKTEVIVPESKSEYTYICPGHGREHKVAVRAKNESGFGTWSDEVTVQTAPGRLPTLTCCRVRGANGDWLMSATWGVPLNAGLVILQLFCKGSEHSLATVSVNADAKAYMFDHHALESGKIFFCAGSALISSVGEGKKRISNEVEIPLELPTVTSTLDARRPTTQVNFMIGASDGMKWARVSIVNSKQRTHTEDIAITSHPQAWSYNCLQAGERFRYMVYPGNSKREFSAECATGDFTTSPPAPLKVQVERHETNLESELTVLVESDYHEKLQVGAENVGPLMCNGNYALITGLRPGTVYNVYAQHNTQGQLSTKTFAGPIRTAYPMPTELRCIPVANSNAVKLTWKDLGERLTYHVLHRAGEETKEAETVRRPECFFYNLSSGRHHFQVYVDPDNKSDTCEIHIPGAPDIHKVSFISSDSVKVMWSKVPKAERYHHKITCIGDKAPISPAWVLEDGVPVMTQEKTVPDASWELEPGLKCRASVRAQWMDFIGPASSTEFTTAYPMPTELRCIPVADSNAVKLAWKDLGERLTYHVLHRAGEETKEAETVRRPECFFYNLSSGRHHFQVYVDPDNKSDTCEIHIPGAPDIHKVSFISSDSVKVMWSKVPKAERYHHKIACIGDKAPISPAWVLEDGVPVMTQEKTVPDASWELERGLKCRTSVRAQWKDFIGPASSTEFTTAYPMPTELRCIPVADSNAVKLAWKDLGERLTYHVLHRAGEETKEAETVRRPECFFYNLSSGRHHFQVYVDPDNKSDNCEIHIPGAPDIHKVSFISSDSVKVMWSKVPKAEKYHHKITCIGDKAPISPAWVLEDGVPVMTQEKTVPDASWELERGLKCRTSVRAQWKDFIGPASSTEFTPEFNVREMANLINEKLNAKMRSLFTSTEKNQGIIFQPPDLQQVHSDGTRSATDHDTLLQQGERCVLLGDSGKTTLLCNFMKQKTKSVLEQSRQDSSVEGTPGIVIHLKFFLIEKLSNCDRDSYMAVLLEDYNFTPKELLALLSYMSERPERLTMVLDNFKSTPQEEHLPSWKILKDILAGVTYPGSSVLCAVPTLEACNLVSPTKVLSLGGFSMPNVTRMAEEMFPAEESWEVNCTLQKFDYIASFCQEKKYCAAVLRVVHSTLFSGGSDTELESPASVAVTSLLKAVSVNYGLIDSQHKHLEDLLNGLATGDVAETESLFGRFLKIVSSIIEGKQPATEKFSLLELRIYSGLCRESTFKKLQKLFPNVRFTSIDERKKVREDKVSKHPKSLLEWVLNYHIDIEMNGDQKNPLKVDIGQKGIEDSTQYKDVLKIMVDHQYKALRQKLHFTYRYQNNKARSHRATKILHNLCQQHDMRKKKISYLDIENCRPIGLDAIIKCLPHIDKLRIADSELNQLDIEQLCGEIEKANIQPREGHSRFVLQYLNLDGNVEVATTLESLEKCCHKLRKISLQKCQIVWDRGNQERYKRLGKHLERGTLIIDDASSISTGSYASVDSV